MRMIRALEVYRLSLRLLIPADAPRSAAPPAAVLRPMDPEQTRPGNDLPYESRHTSFDRKIILITASFLFLLLAVLVAHALTRCLLRRALRSLQPLGAAATTDSTTPSKPMKKRQVTALPTSTFRHPDAAAAEAQCPICLADFCEGDLMRVLPSCQHGFHARCVDAWLYRQATCPTCRADLLRGEQRSRSVEVKVVITAQGELRPSLCGEAKDPA